MKHPLRIAGIVIAIVILVLVVVALTVNVNVFRPQLEANLSKALGRQVTIGDLSFSIFSGRAKAANISISDDPAFESGPFLTANSIEVSVLLVPLIFSHTLNVTGLTILDPNITLLRAPSGSWNFSSLGGSAAKTPASQPSSQGPPQGLSVASFDISGGKITVGDLHSQAPPQSYTNIGLQVRNFSATSQFPIQFSADLPGSGQIKLDATAGPIPTDASLTPVKGKATISGLDLGNSAFIDRASGMGGLANISATFDSNGRELKSNADVKVDKLKVSPKGSPAAVPVELKCDLDHDVVKQAGTIQNGALDLGKAAAKFSGTYQTQGTQTVLALKLDGQNMAVDNLVPLLPALGATLPDGAKLTGGTFSLALNAAGPLAKLVTTGSVDLADTTLDGFDLGSKLSSVSALARVAKPSSATQIKQFSSNLRIAPEGISTSNINVDVPSLGQVTGNGTISSSNALDYHMVAKVGGAAGSVAGVIGSLTGRNVSIPGVPFAIKGTTSNPSFAPDFGGASAQKSGSPAPSTSPLNALQGLFGKKK